MAEIIIFPEYEKTKNEVEKLRTELSMLVLERDELRFVVCKNIEMKYMLELGSLEYKAYEAQCTFLRLKRKIELIQAKINRQEQIDIKTIEEVLDNEFAEYQIKLEEQLGKMNEALSRSKGEFLTDEEAKEIKKLYRRIVKALHPDLHPENTYEQLELFNNAIAAYESGDINTLRIIDEMVSSHELPEDTEDALSLLVKEKERLEGLIKNIQESISRIKNEFPYTVKDIVDDKEKTAARREELEDILKQYEEAISIYKAKIKEMMV